MALNPDKSHAILFGTTERAQSYRGLLSIDVAGSSTSFDSYIKLLGVTLHSHLSISAHTKLVSQSSFITFGLCVTCAVCYLPTATAIASASPVESMSLRYFSLVWLSVQHIALLQRTENAAARVVPQESSHLSSVDTLRELHWLPVQRRMKFKFASLTIKAMHIGTPPYLSDLLIPYCPIRVLYVIFLL